MHGTLTRKDSTAETVARSRIWVVGVIWVVVADLDDASC